MLLRKSETNYLPRSFGQGVKTPPFHGGITGSNPVRTIINFRQNGRKFFCTVFQNRCVIIVKKGNDMFEKKEKNKHDFMIENFDRLLT